METERTTTYYFGDFELDGSKRLLLRDGIVVPLKPKALDLLLTLVENRGLVLTKSDLLDKVWTDQFVEENNLTVHVAALRKALGETKKEHRFITTVPGKGYCFVAELLQPAETEIVVERHKVERIIVEEELVEQVGPSKATAPDSAYLSRFPHTAGNRRTVVAMLCFGLLATSMGVYALRSGMLPALASSAPPFTTSRIRQLTTNGMVGNAALSPDGKLFAYTIDDLGQKSLWLGYVNGGNHIPLRPPENATYRSLAFSPDSSHLYFSYRAERQLKSALYKIPVFGGVPVKVLEGVNSFALSPDEVSVAIARADTEQKNNYLVVAPLDGSNRRDVAAFPQDSSFSFETISWSPDGSRLAVAILQKSDRYLQEVAMVNIADGAVTRIPIHNWRAVTKTAWLSDGRGLLVTAIEGDAHSSVPHYRILHIKLPTGEIHNITVDRSNYGASWHNDAGVSLSMSTDSSKILSVEHRQLSNVWVAPTRDLGAARQITFGSFGKYDGLWGLDWAPDGRLIYTTSDTQSQFIARMNADGSDQRPLTPPGSVDSCLATTPDGRYVVFHSTRGNQYDFDIWRMGTDGSDPRQLTHSGLAYQPAPSADSKWVYFKSFEGGSPRLCKVSIEGGEPVCINEKETSWPSSSPDGTSFAGLITTDKGRLAIFSATNEEVIREFDLAPTGTVFMGTRWTPDSTGVAYRDRHHGYWIQPADGGEPRRLEGLPKERLYNFAWSRDGQYFAFVRGQEIRDVVLIEDTAK